MTKDSSCQNQLWLFQWTLVLLCYLPSVQHDARRTGFNFKSDYIISLYMGFPGISPNYDMTAINHYFRHLLCWILTHPQMLPHPLHISKPELSSPRACLTIHPDVIEHYSLSPPARLPAGAGQNSSEPPRVIHSKFIAIHDRRM